MVLLGELTPLILILCAFLCTRGSQAITAAAWIGSILAALEFLGYSLSFLLVGPMIDAARGDDSYSRLFPSIAFVLSALYGAWYPATLLSHKWRAQVAQFHIPAHFVVAPCALLFPRFSSYDEVAKVLLNDGASIACLIFLWYAVMRLRKVDHV